MACIASSTCINEEVVCQTPESPKSDTLQNVAKQLQYYTSLTTAKEETHQNEDEHGTSSNPIAVESAPAKISDQFSCADSRNRRAAVLVCIFVGQEGELRVVLTKRSMKLFSHPGEVALPGGKMEEIDADDYSATALREAMEEIGLDPDLVQVVANLEPFFSQHLLMVVPVLGLLARIEDFKPVLNTEEVDAIFDVPLEMFLKENSHRCEEREWQQWKYAVHLFDYESEQGAFLIWGLTASILIRAASIVYQRSPPFAKHLPDFQQLQLALNTVA
ncbi:nudix hydrolase 11-like [Cornus florida]|uniref:nudix hydrolase 11-like n=1 Tax=Cornus florida TaxID=4283 RepID=UPI00289A4639|nr:nudix hydrolase 11-like [Cornus florida]